MNRSLAQEHERKYSHRRRLSSRGFSLIELVVVVLIITITTAIAIPIVQNSLRYYAMRSAISSVTAAVEAARYQAIFHGCRYQLVFTAASYSYTVASMVPTTAGATTCLATYGTAGTAIPLMGRGVALGSNSTLQFLPSGQVTSTVGPTNPISFTLTYAPLLPETIQVSNYGRVYVTP